METDIAPLQYQHRSRCHIAASFVLTPDGKTVAAFYTLSQFAVDLAWVPSKQVASATVIVDANDQSARHFYEHFDFLALLSAPNRTFLPMRTIERLFGVQV